MIEDEIYVKLRDAINSFDEENVKSIVKKAIELGVEPLNIIEKGLAKGLKEIGEKFGRGELFLTELMIAAESMKAAIKILEPKMKESGQRRRAKGTVLIGTVSGDVHDIGKSIVSAMLIANGFNVIDLGVDVPTELFVRKVRELNPDILGLSALMSTTMDKQKEVIDALQEAGLRDKVSVLVGGAVVTQSWAEEIGADGFGGDAIEAVEKSRFIVSRKR